jgi:hypothetical protein
MGSEKNQKTGGEKCYEFGWNPDPSNACHHLAAVRLHRILKHLAAAQVHGIVGWRFIFNLQPNRE